MWSRNWQVLGGMRKKKNRGWEKGGMGRKKTATEGENEKGITSVFL